MNDLYVTEDQVRVITPPPRTRTWHPIPHADLLDALTTATLYEGIGIVDKSYCMSKNGMKLFGTWTLDVQDSGIQYMIGFRQGLDRRMAIGICAGTYVTVCSNMMLAGDDFLEFRKHTGRLDFDELVQISIRALGELMTKVREFVKWHHNLKEYPVTATSWKSLVYEGMVKGAVVPSNFTKIIEAWEIEAGLNGESLFSAHGAFTRVMRGENLFNVNKKCKVLKGICEEYIGRCGYNGDNWIPRI